MDRSASIRVAPERCRSGDIEIPGGAGEQWRFPFRTLSNSDCCLQVGTIAATRAQASAARALPPAGARRAATRPLAARTARPGPGDELRLSVSLRLCP